MERKETNEQKKARTFAGSEERKKRIYEEVEEGTPGQRAGTSPPLLGKEGFAACNG